MSRVQLSIEELQEEEDLRRQKRDNHYWRGEIEEGDEQARMVELLKNAREALEGVEWYGD